MKLIEIDVIYVCGEFPRVRYYVSLFDLSPSLEICQEDECSMFCFVKLVLIKKIAALWDTTL
jgi:hypothetical protein